MLAKRQAAELRELRESGEITSDKENASGSADILGGGDDEDVIF